MKNGGRTTWLIALAALAAIAVPVRGGEMAKAKGERLYALQVQPLLAGKCLACHGKGPGEPKGGLDLTSRAGMIRGGKDYGQALFPGDAETSPLYLAVLRTEPGMAMPPKQADALTTAQAWSIRDWINAGAPWPDQATIAAIVKSSASGVIVATSGGLTADWTNRRYAPENLWAYQPLRRPAAPVAQVPAASPIDRFLNAYGSPTIGLRPAPAARPPDPGHAAQPST